ncbi:MAG TPA: double zinc ribbon domain-containing protein [Gemmatimonadaceae bacterium]|nr:double zinc ribbon domain-containing protein [Gemmatimonadaceae bacterium]
MARDALTTRHPRLRSAGESLLDLLLPPACATCGRPRTSTEHDLVCGACWLRAKELPRPRCERCGHPINVSRRPVPCAWCTLLPPYVRAVRSAFALPGGAAETIVHAFKYQGWSAIGEPMARRMATLRFPTDVESERAGVVPVPLAPARQRERGYNQSEVLAAGLARLWNLPLRTDLLSRTRVTQTQTRLTPGERQRNVANAFRSLADRGSLRGLHLVLVDDVVTTAATLNACAAALHDGGVRIVSFVTFGRAPAIGDRW